MPGGFHLANLVCMSLNAKYPLRVRSRHGAIKLRRPLYPRKQTLVGDAHNTALGDVGSGRVSMIIEGYSGMVGAVKAKQVKLIAVATTQRLPQFSDLPTVAETLPGFSATGWQVLLAPLDTPPPIINKVGSDLAKIVTDADFKKRLANVGSYSRAMTPEQVIAFVKKEQETWLPVLQRIAAK